jgi:ubiquinone/menaquinone biosynthesis C-methylase UbiE
MKRIRDPEGIEVKQLINAGQFAGKNVLEIGCGEGWLTWQYADIPSRVTGIDPCFTDLQKCKTNETGKEINFTLTQAAGEKLPFPSGTFDIAVFASSL